MTAPSFSATACAPLASLAGRGMALALLSSFLPSARFRTTTSRSRPNPPVWVEHTYQVATALQERPRRGAGRRQRPAPLTCFPAPPPLAGHLREQRPRCCRSNSTTPANWSATIPGKPPACSRLRVRQIGERIAKARERIVQRQRARGRRLSIPKFLSSNTVKLMADDPLAGSDHDRRGEYPPRNPGLDQLRVASAAAAWSSNPSAAS